MFTNTTFDFNNDVLEDVKINIKVNQCCWSIVHS